MTNMKKIIMKSSSNKKNQNLKQNLEVEIIDITPEIEILNKND